VDLNTVGRCNTHTVSHACSYRLLKALNDTQQMLKTGVADAIVETIWGHKLRWWKYSHNYCIYSSEHGNQMASTLIQMFQDRVASTNTVISVANQNVTIKSACSYPTCAPTPDAGAIGLGTYLGGLLTGIISSLVQQPLFSEPT